MPVAKGRRRFSVTLSESEFQHLLLIADMGGFSVDKAAGLVLQDYLKKRSVNHARTNRTG